MDGKEASVGQWSMMVYGYMGIDHSMLRAFTSQSAGGVNFW